MEKKYTAQFIFGIFTTICGLALLFIGLFMPPIGVIHSSLLVAFGEVATFSGALIGIDYSYKIKAFINNKKRDSE